MSSPRETLPSTVRSLLTTVACRVRWGRQLIGDPRSHLVFEWQEIGGPSVGALGNSSFGTSTIRDLIPYELGGTADFVLALEGVRLPPGTSS